MLLVPGFAYADLGPDGGPYDEHAHPKVCWHTTEGSSLAGAEAAFRGYPPHLGYDPRTRQARQYVSLDRHSYALRGGESDDEYVIQVEVVGRAAETPNWPAEWYRNIGEDVVRPLRVLVGVPDAHLRFYAPSEVPFPLATERSPIRLTDAAFRSFSGHLGHQHVPAPDVHWDPGGFRLDLAVAASYAPTRKKVDHVAYAYELPAHGPDDPDDFREAVIPLPPQHGATGVQAVWVTLANSNGPLVVRVAHWQCGAPGDHRTVPLSENFVVDPLGTSGGLLSPADAYSLVIDYRSPYGASAVVEPVL